MKTSDRSKEAQNLIKDRLGSYFSEKQLDMLDDLGIEILNDYFSNNELRDLQEAPAAVLKGFVDRNQSHEVKRRLTQIKEDELDDLMSWYEENCSEIELVIDPATDEPIALEVKHNTMKNSTSVHWDGRFIVAIGDRLAATRTRLDGVVGYQSAMQVQDPAFVDAYSKFYDEREKKLKVYQGKVEKSKAAHQKKVDAALAQFEKDIKEYDRIMALFNQGPKPINPKPIPDSKPKKPVYKEPEYVALSDEEWEEPERPEVEQFLPPTDTRWSEVETEVIPEEHIMSSITNSDIVNVKRHIESTGYKKPVRKVKDGYKVDGFILRKVK